MSAQPWVRGPGHIFAGVGTGKAPVYFGTAKRTPRISIRPGWVDFFNSLFSPVLPMDKVFAGEEILVIATMNRFDEAVFGAMQSLRGNTTAANRGNWPAGGLGTMQIYESVCFPLWVQFPYYAKTAYGSGNSGSPGYRIYNGILLGPDDLDNIGMEPAENQLIWWGGPTLTPGVNNTVVGGTYDHTMTGLPAVS